MLNEKRIKALIIVSLLLIESFVWIVNGPNNSWSLGFFGGDGGHASVDQPGGNAGGGQPQDENNSGQPPGEPLPNNGGQPASNDGQPDPGSVQPPAQNDDSQSGPNPGEGNGQADAAGYPPADNPDRNLALKEAEDKGLLILVNKEHPVDKDYKPDDLVKIRDFVPDRSETTRYMRSEAAVAFEMLVGKAAEDGVVIKMTTAYRSYDFQKVLFDNYVEKEGEEKANTFSAKPGQSEHQTGLAVDVSSPSVDYQLSDDYGKTKEGKWLSDNAYRFGFILRFPKGKEDITGYQYEPWHLRYVGLTAAKEIHEQGITLEEYLQENGLE